MAETRKPRRPTRRKLQYARAVENYLAAGGPPRWMTRLVEIDRGIASEKRRLAEEYEAMREWAGDEFSSRWRAFAQRQRFDDLNELIAQHNEWFPVERNLAMDIRTRDYVLIHGRPYRRQPLDAAWVLSQFPARP
jgi:hypothetical protein